VKVDQNLHREVLNRFQNLHLSSLSGFINPIYAPGIDSDRNITDIKISYYENYNDKIFEIEKNFNKS
jgi:dipeptidyl-peptidase-3